MDLFTQYAVVTAEMALKDAGLSAEEGGNLDPDRAGSFGVLASEGSKPS